MIARTLPTRGRVALALLLAGLATSSLAGCGSAGRRRNDNVPNLGIIDPHLPKELEMVSHPQHVIEPPDEIEISVRPNLVDMATTTLTVRADGNIDLGFHGDVYVSGLTLDQAEQKIAQHLLATLDTKRNPIREPIVASVRLVSGRDSKRYYVLGTVSTQNSFPLTGNETVVDAILQAGLKSNSLPDKAYLVRPHPNGGADQIYRIDWVAITQHGNTLTNYQLLPGDRIYVPGGKAPSVIQSLFGGG